MKIKYWFFFILCPFGSVFAQEKTIFYGVVIDAKTQVPLEHVVVSIQNSAITQLTQKDGKFELHSTLSGYNYF